MLPPSGGQMVACGSEQVDLADAGIAMEAHFQPHHILVAANIPFRFSECVGGSAGASGGSGGGKLGSTSSLNGSSSPSPSSNDRNSGNSGNTNNGGGNQGGNNGASGGSGGNGGGRENGGSATAGSKPQLWTRTPIPSTLQLKICVPILKNRVFTCIVDDTQSIASLKLFLWVEVFGLQNVSIPGSHLDYVFRAEEDDYFSEEKMRLCDSPYYIECLRQRELETLTSTASSGSNSSSTSSNSSLSMQRSPSHPESSFSSNASAGKVSSLSSPTSFSPASSKPIISLFLVSTKEILEVNGQIESMIGYKLCQSEEAKAFRKEMHNVVNRVMQVSYRRLRVPQLSPFDNVDGYLPSQFNAHVWFWHETSVENHQAMTITARLHDTANAIIQRILIDHPYYFRNGSESPEDYVLKLRGIDDWVFDTIQLVSLDYVRNSLRMRRKVEIIVYAKEAVPSHISTVLKRYEMEKGRTCNNNVQISCHPGEHSSSSPSTPLVSSSSSQSLSSTSQRSTHTSSMNAQSQPTTRAYRGGNALDSWRASVAMGFDMSTVFKSEDRSPPSWYKSWDLTDKPLTVKIRSVDHIAFESSLFKLPKKRDALTHIFVAATVVTPSCVPSGSNTAYHAIGQTARTLPELYLEESLEPITWRADLFLPPYSMIPRASKLRLEIVVRYKETETTIAWWEQPIFSYSSIVRDGIFSVNCALGNSTTCASTWISNGVPISSIFASSSGDEAIIRAGAGGVYSDGMVDLSLVPGGPTLVFEIEPLDAPVVFPSSATFSSYDTYVQTTLEGANSSEKAEQSAPSMQAYTQLQSALSALLHRPTKQEQFIFWKHRPWCMKNAKTMDLFLASIPWSKQAALQFSYLALDRYAQPAQPLDAIRLLSKNHLEPRFREHAVRILHRLSDSELAEVLLQLVQSLKHELSHDSALARFLLVRALFNQTQIGHYFYWHLKACMTMPVYRDRFSLVLEVYLRYCSSFRQELLTQTLIYNRLISVATELKLIKDPTKRIPFLHNCLYQIASTGLGTKDGPIIPMPPTFQLPISCNLIGKHFNVAKCKNLESKTLPLWLVADSADPLGDPVYGIMKVGDDLRQDQLTLQMFALMDKLWLQNGLDLKMSCYRVIETGMECGMIEVVPNAQTNAQIQKQYGGVTAAFSEKPLFEWLQRHNPNEHDFASAVRDFASSCAGYCVATYVLGIGDRHNDNIMITKTGHLFHIDFGRFLGNSEKFAGVSRDRAPFVFTPEFAYVMGGQNSPIYSKFVQQACLAYNIVRRNAALFTSLLAMMLQTGIPELRSEDDIAYLTDAFSLDLSDDEASQKFSSLISKSLETTATQLNFAIHIWANPEK